MALEHSKECDIHRGKDCSCGTDEMEFSSAWGTDLRVILDGDGAWKDLQGRKVHHVKKGIQVAGLNGGTSAGRPSVAIRIDLPDGSVVLAETTLRLFSTAASALKAKYGVED